MKNLRIFFRKIYFKLTKKISENYLSKFRNKKLNNKSFTIISNNCWAGWVYRRYNLPYLTPTVGLFIMPSDYIKFIKNIKYYISLDLKFINPSNSKHKKYIAKHNDNFGKYPIGVLDEIEIHFLHYKSEKEAYEKWTKRKKRINYEQIIYKFNDQNGCSIENVEDFEKIDVDNKIFFTSNKLFKKDEFIFVKEFEDKGYVMDDMLFCTKYLSLTQYINNINKKR